MRSLLVLFLVLLIPPGVTADSEVRLTDQQRATLEALAPGIEVTPELVKLMEQIALQDANKRPVAERMRIISQVAGLADLPQDQRMTMKFCIWDIAGRAGPIFQAADEQRAQAMEMGINVELAAYTNEGVMVDEFLSGRCDAALMSGLRAREFNTFSGTIDAIGALPDMDHVRMLYQALAHPTMSPHMVQGEYVVLGVFPAGPAHIFVNDRKINSIARAAGKRVAVLEHDPMQAQMISMMGATPVASDLSRAPRMFNNGVVDVLAAPLVAYELLELYRGMDPDGGIVDMPLTQLSMQLIGRRSSFPQEVAQLIREATHERFDEVLEFLDRETARVPDKWMIPIPPEDRMEYETMMQDARVALREMNYYDGRMLTLQRRIRCRFDAERAECVDRNE